MTLDFGVQTFTVRKHQKKNIRAAYLPLIEVGIRSFEVARIDFSKNNANEIKSLVDEFGIEIKSIQVKPKKVFGDVEEVVSFCKAVGCKRVVISMLPFKCILGNDGKFYSFISTLDRQFEIYEKHGITLAYHHHNWEYIKLENGKTRMEELLSRTKKIKFVNDTYWTARCGTAPDEEIERFGDRLLGIHLRDLTFKRNKLKVTPRDTFIGDGVIDFKKVLIAAESVGCEYLVIEQNTRTPYEDIARSFTELEKTRRNIHEK